MLLAHTLLDQIVARKIDADGHLGLLGRLLERALLLEHDVFGQIHRAHTVFAEQLENSKLAYLRADHGRTISMSHLFALTSTCCVTALGDSLSPTLLGSVAIA